MAVHGAAGLIPGRDRMRAIKIGWWQVGGLLELVTGQPWPTAAYADELEMRTVEHETRRVAGVVTSESRTVGMGAL